jgi:hypothetical protein
VGALLDAALFAYHQNPLPAARMYQSSAQTVGNATNTTINFDTIDYDTSGTAIADVTNDRLIANRTGIWVVSFGMRFQSNASTAERAIGIYRNGSTSDRVTGSNGYGTYQVLVCTTTLRMCTGDYIQALAWQATGGNLNVDLSLEPCQLTAVYAGPA